MKPVLLVVIVLLLVFTMTALAQKPAAGKPSPTASSDNGSPKSPAGFTSLPLTISYQGLLTTSGGTPVQDGNYDIQFKFFQTPTGGSTEWTESHSGVAVAKGTFNVILGSTTSLNNFDFNRQLYLEVTATAGPSGPSYPITFPRSAMTSAPSALAPWTVSSGNIHFNTGNVGIGIDPSLYGNLQVSGANPGIVLNEVGSANSNIVFKRGGLEQWYLLQNYNSPADNIAFYDASTFGKVFQINPGGNVGIGTESPSEKLEVAGNIELSGDVRYSTPKTGYVTATGWALGRPFLSTDSFTWAGGLVNNGTGGQYFEVPLQLPHGVTLTEVNVYGYDVDGGTELSATLAYQLLSAGGGGAIALGGSGVGYLGGPVTISMPVSTVIDNSAFAYFLELGMPNTANVAYYSFRATYTYTSEGYSASQLQSPANRPANSVEDLDMPSEHYGGSIRKNK